MVDNIAEQQDRFTRIRRGLFRVELEPEDKAVERQLERLVEAESNLDFLRVFLPTIAGGIPQERTLVLLNRFHISLPDTDLPYSLHFENEQEIFQHAAFGIPMTNSPSQSV